MKWDAPLMGEFPLVTVGTRIDQTISFLFSAVWIQDKDTEQDILRAFSMHTSYS
jgi:hypothetical protein